MRSAQPIFRLVLGLLFIGLFSGCSGENDLRLRYDAEKRLHQAERLLYDAGLKNELDDPAVLSTLRVQFEGVSKFTIAALDSLTPSADPMVRAQLMELAFQSTTRLSHLLLKARAYDNCVALLDNLYGKVKLPPLEAAVVWVNIGQAYQAKGEWDKAVAVYNQALERTDPPLDEKGEVIFDVLNLPAHIYSVYTLIGDSAQATASFDRACKYYSLFTTKFPNSRLGLSSFANLAALHIDRKMWPEAVAELASLRDSTGQTNWEAQVRMADILGGEMKQYDTAMSLYVAAEGRLDGPDTLARPVIFFKKSLSLLRQKKYDAARQVLRALNQQYPAFYAANPTAQLAKAKSFDDEGNWDRAETEYRFLIDTYAGSDEAMSSYLYLGEQLKKRGRTVEADRWANRANSFYQQIADKNSGTEVEARAMTYQAELLRRDSNWAGSVAKLMQIFDKFPNLGIGQRAAIAAAGITRDKLADKAKADSIISALKQTLTAVEPPAQN